MSEKNLNFDLVIDRTNTKSLKYDFHDQRNKPADLIPLWVADMDFKVSSYIVEALDQINHQGIFGYSESDAGYFAAVQNWMQIRHDYQVESEWLVKTPGIVFALAAAVQAFTKKGDAVLIQQPVYYPFFEVVEDNGRKLVATELIRDWQGRYQIDFADLENQIVTNQVKMMILCSPHNPIGRVWSKEELIRIGEICLKHNVLVIADEIHSDFVHTGRHYVFSTLKPEFGTNAIICTSPSKSFNIAGLQVSNIFIENKALRKKFTRQISANGYSQLSLPGFVACQVAYEKGQVWLDQVNQYIYDNYLYLLKFIGENIPRIKVTPLEGTYLVWLDFGSYKLEPHQISEIIEQEAKLWLDDGLMFGGAGASFQRINIACSRSLLARSLEQLKIAFEDL